MKIRKSSILFGVILILIAFFWSVVSSAQDTRELYYLVEKYYNEGEYEKVIPITNQIIQQEPSLVSGYLLRGETYYNLGRDSKTIEDITKALDIESRIGQRKEFSRFYIMRGIAYRNLKNFDKAIEDYQKAINVDPKSYSAYYNLGNAYQDIGNVTRDKKQYLLAIDSYSKAIELKPDFVQALNNRGSCYIKSGQYEKGISELEKQPLVYSYGIGIAFAYEKLGNKEKAIETYKKIFALMKKEGGYRQELLDIIEGKIVDYDNAYTINFH